MAISSGIAVAIVSAGDQDPVAGPTLDPATRPGSPPAPPLPAAIGSGRAVALALALGLILPAMTDAQSVPAFAGRYRFVLTVSPSCPPSMQVGPLSVVMDVAETPVSAGSELSGQSASPSEIPQNGRFVLLRQGNRLHGASSASTIEFGLNTEGVYRVWMQIMTDGSASMASSGRARASGTAFGEVELSLASDPTGNPIDNGYCAFALGHQWSLEPA